MEEAGRSSTDSVETNSFLFCVQSIFFSQAGPSVRPSVRQAFGHAFAFRPSRSDICRVYDLVYAVYTTLFLFHF